MFFQLLVLFSMLDGKQWPNLHDFPQGLFDWRTTFRSFHFPFWRRGWQSIDESVNGDSFNGSNTENYGTGSWSFTVNSMLFDATDLQFLWHDGMSEIITLGCGLMWITLSEDAEFEWKAGLWPSWNGHGSGRMHAKKLPFFRCAQQRVFGQHANEI